MAEELQQLLEKIQRDGVDKANAEAAAIVAKANAIFLMCFMLTFPFCVLQTAQSIPQFKAKRSPENADFPRSIRKRILQGRFSCKRILHVYLRKAVFCYTLAARKGTADGKEAIENEKINPDCISRNVHLNTMRGKRIRMATAP